MANELETKKAEGGDAVNSAVAKASNYFLSDVL